MKLTNEEVNRYSRHLRLPEVGLEGQECLKQSKILIVGSGGLGCPIGMYLGAAGVGTIGLMDFDVVDLSNLQRQIAYGIDDIGKPKVEQLRHTIRASNPNIDVPIYSEGVNNHNALEVFAQYDVIVDGSDNFNTRYLVNDASFLTKKPLVYGSIFRFQGQMTVFNYENSACYRCLYESPPPASLVPNCAEGGVLGVLPGTVGMIQATETIKVLLNRGQTLANRLLLFDAMRMNFKEVKIHKNPNCSLCGEQATIHELQDYDTLCNVSITKENQDEKEFDEQKFSIAPVELKAILKERSQEIKLVDVREQHEWDICHIENAILIPSSEFDRRFHELDPNHEVYLYCYKGTRSMKALKKLYSAGFRQIKSIEGGIDRWAELVDPSMPRY